MDINSGRTFASRKHAMKLGVKPEDVVLMHTSATREDMITMLVNEPELLVASGPFKARLQADGHPRPGAGPMPPVQPDRLMAALSIKRH